MKKFWQFWKRHEPVVDAPPLQWKGEEEYTIPELGGRVAVRGLTAHEMMVAVRGVKTLPVRRDHTSALGIAMLIGGVLYPRLDAEAAFRFARQHPDRAIFLIERIRYLSERRLRTSGLIR